MKFPAIALLGLALAQAMALAPVASAQTSPAIDKNDIASASNALACDLFRQLAPAPGDNACLSPYSIETALAMTWAGARGDTAAQMASVLHLKNPVSIPDASAAFGKLQSALDDSEKKSGIELAVANSLWPQQDHPILPDYLKTVQDGFGSAIFPVDYKTQADAARRRINAWVEDKTQKRIQNLLQPGDVSDATRLILVNAIYFKGNWMEKFDPAQNADAPFTLANGSTQTATLMHKEMNDARYAEISDGPVPMQILTLPYKGGAIEFDALLPNSPKALPDLVKSLDATTLAAWLAKTVRQPKVEVFLPKFKLNTRYGLVPPLKALGMAVAFSDKADFSGMDGQHDLAIASVVHQAFIEVNEEGTEAAASTAVGITALAMPAKPPPIFRADHPFLFIIRDSSTGAILFLGQLATPPN